MSDEHAARPVAMTIAGSDSSGGAGIQADLKTFTVLGCFGATALTAITAQNTQRVTQVHQLAPGVVATQIDAVAEDLPIAALKTGMLGSAQVVRAVAEAIQRHQLRNIVIDPVMVAKSGDPLIDDAAVAAVRRHLLPLATILTPNRHEAQRLLGGGTIETIGEAKAAASEICSRFGVGACIIKAIRSADRMQDALHLDGHLRLLDGPHHPSGGTHGSGCAFSAAITAYLALGQSLDDAVGSAKRFINDAIGRAQPRGRGTRPVDPQAFTSA